MNSELHNWLSSLISGIVSRPTDVIITEQRDDMGVLFSIRLAKEDHGKIIGKDGQHAQALRILLRSAGSLHNVRASLKIDIPFISKNASTNTSYNKIA
mgnify:CR=1 FL=1